MSSSAKSWSSIQKSMAERGWRIGIVLTIAIFLGGFCLFPFNLPPLKTELDRIVFTLKWEMFSAIMLIIGMNGVMSRRRGTIAADPVKGNAEHHVQTQKNILQNTLEQFVIHFVGQLLLAVYLPPESMKAIPVIVVLFVTGRILFKIGYEAEPMQRVSGFMMTFLPTMFTYLYCTYCFIKETLF